MLCISVSCNERRILQAGLSDRKVSQAWTEVLGREENDEETSNSARAVEIIKQAEKDALEERRKHEQELRVGSSNGYNCNLAIPFCAT